MASPIAASHWVYSSELGARMMRPFLALVGPKRRRMVWCILSRSEHWMSLTVESMGKVEMPPATRGRWMMRLKTACFALARSASTVYTRYTELRSLHSRQTKK
jgi:hypothetical protein